MAPNQLVTISIMPRFQDNFSLGDFVKLIVFRISYLYMSENHFVFGIPVEKFEDQSKPMEGGPRITQSDFTLVLKNQIKSKLCYKLITAASRLY